MASSFGQYTGGIQGVQGMSEAGANIGRTVAGGYEAFGKSLADGLKAYNDNSSKNDILAEQLKGLGGAYQEIHDLYKNNPEMKEFADSLTPTMEALKNYGSMSLPQRQGALLAGQAAYAQIAPRLAMFKDNALSMAQQGMQDALSTKVTVPTTIGGTPIQSLPFDTTRTVAQNLDLNRNHFLLEAKKQKLDKFDIKSALDKLSNGLTDAFANDANLAKSDPRYRDIILKGLSDWREGNKIQSTIENQTSDEYGTGENIISQVQALGAAQEGAAVVPANARRALDAPPSDGVVNSVTDTPTESDKSIEQILAERKLSEIKPKTKEDALVAEFAKSVIANTRKTLDDTIRTGGNITIGDISRDINTFEIKNNPTSKEVIVPAGIGGYGTVTSPSRYSDIGKALTEAAEELKIPTDKPMTADQMYQLRQKLGSKSIETGVAAEKSAKTLAELKPSTVGLGKSATEQKTDNYDKSFNYSTSIQEGSVTFQRDMTAAEDKDRARQWFVDNKGVVPSSFEAIYKSMRPESAVQIIAAPGGGRVMIGPDGKAQYIEDPKPVAKMTSAQLSTEGLYNYGVRDPSNPNAIIAKELTPNSGIKLAGFVTGGEKAAEGFRQLHDDAVKIRDIVPKLLAMYKKGIGNRLIPNADWGEAKTLLVQLKAAIRLETIGSGPIAIAEHKMLMDRIADPTAIFQNVNLVGESTLQSLMNRVESNLKNNSVGVKVSFASRAEDKDGIERQARINSKK